LLLEWISENHILWDCKSMDFKKTDRKNGLWEEKGTELGKPAAYLKGWWKGIRDTFTRLHKLKSGAASKKFTEREKWILSNCVFYAVNVSHRGKPVKSVSKILI